MSWQVQYTRTFVKEMARLPANVRSRVNAIAFGEEMSQDPFLAGKTQKLTGYRNFYKIGVGDYRIGLYIDAAEQLVEFQRVLHRRNIYREFPSDCESVVLEQFIFSIRSAISGRKYPYRHRAMAACLRADVQNSRL